ncbi:unnamed protein product [Anisakis simplex]|uniref:Uncharacterized protein n=1 Tax=Anisakis simplex TaxID=6269 RepID=A0A0M3K685_ANISI|nr:unnamed protein product [Anisakis simplex]
MGEAYEALGSVDGGASAPPTSSEQTPSQNPGLLSYQ